ncbi:hypothetical protein BKA66DRAFT_473286 [Pyrenochaeta sp. MPI-SDFR-AT-0127]|nr:hypothetical protein BKA66DRAFT_473286 [Pyrenochaeta sp. MPI-SDFR-AT-0127]
MALALALALVAALLVAHGVARGRPVAVLGGAQLAGNGGGGGGDGNRLRTAARVRAGRRRRGMGFGVLEARGRWRGLRFALGLDAQCLDRLSSSRRVVVRVRGVEAFMVRGAM